MIQIANAIAAHEPARERNLDIVGLKEHLLRVLSDIVGSVRDEALPFEPSDAQLIFGGILLEIEGFSSLDDVLRSELKTVPSTRVCLLP